MIIVSQQGRWPQQTMIIRKKHKKFKIIQINKDNKYGDSNNQL